MWVHDLPAGARVGLDTNLFVYHLCGQSAKATEALRLVEQGRLRAAIPREVLLELSHRMMVVEAVQAGLVRGGNPAAKLKRQPDAIRSLDRHARDIQALLAIGVEVLPALSDPLAAIQPVRRRYGLLTTDAVIAASLLKARIPTLITADRDFERIDELDVLLVDDV